MRATWAAVAAVVALVVSPVGAGAEERACSDGPAYAASRTSPHTIDELGETVGPFSGATDIDALWVGVHPAENDRTRAQYTVNLALADATAHPVGHLFVANLSTGASVGAEALPDGSWQFGFYASVVAPAGLRQAWIRSDSVIGAVDAEDGVISFELPDYVLPSGTDRRTTTMSVGGDVALVAGVPESAGGGVVSARLAVPMDSTVGQPRCTAQLSGLPEPGDA